MRCRVAAIAENGHSAAPESNQAVVAAARSDPHNLPTTEERFDYDERLCSALRQVPELKVHHSTRMDSEAARKLLHRFFARHA